MSASNTDSSEELPLLSSQDGRAAKGPSAASFLEKFGVLFTLSFWRAKLTPENLRICVYFVLLVIAGIANNISGRWNQLKFGDEYAFFNNQWTTLCYCLLAQLITTYKYYFTNDFTPEMKAFPKWKFALFGFFDGTAAFLFSIGAPNTPATLQNLINQLIIPATMVAAFFYLRARFPLGKIGGAVVIMGGVGIALIPLFLKKGVSTVTFRWYSTLIYFSNNIPQALSNVTKEKAFSSVPMDVYYMGSWVSWFQLIVSLLLMPVTVLPGFGGIPFEQMPQQFVDGFKCFLGFTDMSNTAGHCHLNFVYTTAYILINFAYNILILLVTKHAGATVFTLAFAIRLPITQMLYTWKVVMGSNHEPFYWEDIVALIVVLIGFGIYSSISSPSAEEAAADETGKIARDTTDEQVVVLPALNSRGGAGELFQRVRVPIRHRTSTHIRKTYLGRLGIDPVRPY
jgi:hypothetical protein